MKAEQAVTKTTKTVKLPAEVADDIQRILDYLWHDEQKHYRESLECDAAHNHIFTALRAVRSWLSGQTGS